MAAKNVSKAATQQKISCFFGTKVSLFDRNEIENNHSGDGHKSASEINTESVSDILNDTDIDKLPDPKPIGIANTCKLRMMKSCAKHDKRVSLIMSEHSDLKNQTRGGV